ncbi:MAG: methyl-accepting chemotaxis protein [Spirochaetota bacterium]|nr:methyl-accepting chemotaxis protein [Spirochaetota bacterium]
MEGAIRAFMKSFYLYTTLVEYCIIIPLAVIAITLSTDIPVQQLYSILIIIGIVAAIALVVFPPVQKYMFKPFMQMADALKEGKEIDTNIKILIRERLFALPVMRSFIGIVFWLSSIIVVVGGMWILHIDIETILVCFVVGACILIAVGFAMILVPQILISKFIADNDFIKDLLGFAKQKNISFWGSLKNALTISISAMILLAVLLVASSSLLFVFKARINEYGQQMQINASAIVNDVKNYLNTGIELVSVAAREGSIDTLAFLKGKDEIVDVFILNDERNATVLRSLTGKAAGLKSDTLGMTQGMKKGKSFIGDFVYIPEIQRSVVVSAAKNNNLWYCICYDVNAMFQKKFLHYKIGNHGYMLIMDKNGLFLAHPKTDYIGRESLKKYDWGNEAFQEKKVVKYIWEGERKFVYVLENSEPSFAVAQTVYEKDIGIAIRNTIVFVGLLALGVIILGILASTLILTFAFEPFTVIRDAIYRISEGDISITPEVIYGNEIGIIATSVKTLTSKIGSVIRQIKNYSDELSTASEQMSAGISALSEVASNQSASTQEITATIEEISANLDSIVINTKDESKSLGEFSSHLQELSQSIFSFLLIMEESAQRTESISNDAQQGQISLQQMNTSMHKIVESSRGISNIAQIIRGIADQVNLLALNAAIEAARAGEAGRGFAVVADEITKLADQIAQSLKDIDVLVKTNEKEIQQGITITENTVATISNIIKGIESISHEVNTMGQKIKEQSEMFNETKQVWDSTETLSRQILNSVEDQKEAIDEIVRSINTINSLTQVVAGTAEEMNSSAENLASMAQQLKAMLEYFKL